VDGRRETRRDCVRSGVAPAHKAHRASIGMKDALAERFPIVWRLFATA